MAIATCALCGRSVPAEQAIGWICERRLDGGSALLCDHCQELAVNVAHKRDSDRATKLIAAGWKSVRHGWWRREIMGPSFSLGDAWARLQADEPKALTFVEWRIRLNVRPVDGERDMVDEVVRTVAGTPRREAVALAVHRWSGTHAVEVVSAEVRS